MASKRARIAGERPQKGNHVTIEGCPMGEVREMRAKDGSSDCTAGENSTEDPIGNAGSTDKTVLQLIYGTIKELHTESQMESRRTRMATKQLQASVWKVAKTCRGIEEKLSTIESRISTIEAETEGLKEQAEKHGGQLTDIMWTLEDYENRQRRNKLRFLGIEEKGGGKLYKGIYGQSLT
ncbi:hypothetical protein NDU88_006696 [Pleurodeles waltl]|uniref:Uncharacterized protein n=1 Tax=Pleurodeles waltl TaxID=8319 RepID=A0AAV7VRC9_PLEWA|nr:hypothetical protein NDU88_006696 [Pleurodeles waltl]